MSAQDSIPIYIIHPLLFAIVTKRQVPSPKRLNHVINAGGAEVHFCNKPNKGRVTTDLTIPVRLAGDYHIPSYFRSGTIIEYTSNAGRWKRHALQTGRVKISSSPAQSSPHAMHMGSFMLYAPVFIYFGT
jgi:hypothetical protein